MKKTNKERFEEAYDEALTETSSFIEEAHTDLKFYVGDQWTSEEKANLKKFNRDPVVFNYIRRFIKRVAGYQRKNRLATNIEPTENQDQYISELYDDTIKWVNKRSKIYHKISDAFEKGSLVTGWNLIHTYVDYSSDPINGNIKASRRGYNTFLLAPDFTELDLSDCRYIITCDFMSRDDAKRLLPKKAKKIDELAKGQVDNKFEFIGTNHLKNDDIVSFVEFWERIAKKAYMTFDNISGESKEWRGSKKDLEEYIKDFPWVKYIQYYKQTVQQTIFIQGEEMFHGEDPMGSKERMIPFDEYPFTLVAGYHEPDIDISEYKISGLARHLRWVQKEENKRKSQMFSILDSAPHGGYIAKNGSVVNYDDLYQTGPGVVITIDEAAQMSDVQELRPREIPQSTMMLSQQLKQDLVELGGGSEEFMGTADMGNSQISGTLAKVRASNSVESLQDLLDNLSFAQEDIGMKFAKLVRINFTKELIQRITGKEVPEEFFNEEVEKFDILAAEGMLTDTNRNLAYVQSLQARDRGIPIPNKFIIANMPIANKSELMESFEEEQQQLAFQQQKIEEQEDVTKRLANAETVHKLSLAEQQRKHGVALEALAIERVSESKLNQAKVIESRMDAVLKRIEASKELEDMDFQRLQTATRFILEMYEEQRQDELSQSAENSQQINNEGNQALFEVDATDKMNSKVEEPSDSIPQQQQQPMV